MAEPSAAIGSVPAQAPVGHSYPPAPWELYGQAQMHLLLTSTAGLQNLPQGFRPLSLGGRSLVIAGFIDYQHGSVLDYGELFAAPIGFATARTPRATVTHMWVDSPSSLQGGRELWGYPKQLASFQIEGLPEGAAAAADDQGEIASGSLARSLVLPPAIAGVGGTVQPQAGELRGVRACFRMFASVGRGSFRVRADGPLGFLDGASLLCSFGLRDFHFTFGI